MIKDVYFENAKDAVELRVFFENKDKSTTMKIYSFKDDSATNVANLELALFAAKNYQELFQSDAQGVAFGNAQKEFCGRIGETYPELSYNNLQDMWFEMLIYAGPNTDDLAPVIGVEALMLKSGKAYSYQDGPADMLERCTKVIA